MGTLETFSTYLYTGDFVAGGACGSVVLVVVAVTVVPWSLPGEYKGFITLQSLLRLLSSNRHERRIVKGKSVTYVKLSTNIE